MVAQPLNAQTRLLFLTALAETGIVKRALEIAGVSLSEAYELRRADKGFKASWDLALTTGHEVLEDEVKRRAFEGVEEPIVYQGQLTPVWERDTDGEILMTQPEDGSDPKPIQARNRDGSLKWLTVKKYSDSLAALVMKARVPAYRDKQELNVTGQLTVAQAILAGRKRSSPPAAAVDPDEIV